MRAVALVTFLSLMPCVSLGLCAGTVSLEWSELPPLPPSAGQSVQPGVASPFAGVHRDALIVAGGANFPDKMPWEGGAKVWWDDIWVLPLLERGAPRWILDSAAKLPRRIGYGVSVSTREGVVCAGGSDAEQCFADVFMLSWDPERRAIKRTELPSMPAPLANMAGALVGTTLYVAGGQQTMKNATGSSMFWALDLAKRDRPAEFKWVRLPSWPGPMRILPVAAAQRTANGEEFFLFGGRNPRSGQPTKILTDAYAFNPATGTWRRLANINGGAGLGVMGAVAAPIGHREILLFGGDRGELFSELEGYDVNIEARRRRMPPSVPAQRVQLQAEIDGLLEGKRKIYASHPGFGREVLAYDTGTDTWRVVTRAPVPLPVTTVAVKWGDAMVIPSGEIRPGVRTPAVIQVTPKAK